jgi:tetratricopeptide (TPR) repeat protein
MRYRNPITIAAFLWMVTAQVMPALAAPAATIDSERAHRAFLDGASAYQLGRFEEAIGKFEESYRIAKLAIVLYSLAQAHRRMYETGKDLEQLRQAIDLYRAFLREAPGDEPKRALAEQFLAELTRTMAAESERRNRELLVKVSGGEAVALAQRLMAEGALKEAAAVLDRVLGSLGNPRSVLVAALEQRAICAARLGDQERAIAYFERALVLDPGFLVAESEADAVKGALAAARRAAAGKSPLALSHVPPGIITKTEAPIRIAVTVDSDPLHMIDSVGLWYRLSGAGAFSVTKTKVKRSGATENNLEIPSSFATDLRGSVQIEYYLEAVDSTEGELASLGSPEKPFVLKVIPPLVATETRGGTPVYRKWWLWTLVGALAVGAAVAVAAVELSPKPFNPETVPVTTKP